jgi:radical SAM-linked protein
MLRTRLLFTKTGRAIYISHLDLMRTFQRVFMRAGIQLRHTEGFNPHPYMNFALPLSVGCASVCELLDFDIPDGYDLEKLPMLLNQTMPEGIEAIKAYIPMTKFTSLVWLEIEGSFFYDAGVSDQTVSLVTALFAETELIISKKSKKGCTDTNIMPCIHSINFALKSREEIKLRGIISAQNPSLNPENLIMALKAHLPSCVPDFASFKRMEVYDINHTIYR